MNTLLNANLHFEAEFIRQQFPGLRRSKTRKLMFAAIIDDALDEGDILTAQEICEQHGAAMSRASLDDVERELRDLEAAMELIDDGEVPFYEELIVGETDAVSGKIIPFRSVA